MKKLLVYDLPTRIFHGLFAIGFLFAFIIGKTIDDENLLFSYHMLTGITVGALVLIRVLWLFIGTRHARLTGFALKPADLIQYFQGILKNDKRKWAGHNPASSWAGLVMMLLALGLATSGVVMTSNPLMKENIEEIHELMANAFILVVIGHVLGIALHTYRHKELIGLSMLDGKKQDIPADQSIDSAKPAWGIAYLAAVLIFGFYVFSSFDSAQRSLNLGPLQLQLGESGNEAESQTPNAIEHESQEEDD